MTSGSVVMGVLTGSGLRMNLPESVIPLPEDSERGLRKGSKSIKGELPEVGMVWGGPGVLGLEEDLPLVPLLALLCFLYLTWKIILNRGWHLCSRVRGR